MTPEAIYLESADFCNGKNKIFYQSGEFTEKSPSNYSSVPTCLIDLVYE